MNYLPLAARVCLALIFLKAGISHITGFPGFVQTIASKSVPLPGIVAVGTIVFLLLGSLSVLVGYKAKIGALLLIIFLIPTTLLFHPLGSDVNGFLKNLALIGGLLMVMAYGTGPLSVDSAAGKAVN
ncbi:MAG: DoxX family protein [Cyanobacteria bacterium J06632_3]